MLYIYRNGPHDEDIWRDPQIQGLVVWVRRSSDPKEIGMFCVTTYRASTTGITSSTMPPTLLASKVVRKSVAHRLYQTNMSLRIDMFQGRAGLTSKVVPKLAVSHQTTCLPRYFSAHETWTPSFRRGGFRWAILSIGGQRVLKIASPTRI